MAGLVKKFLASASVVAGMSAVFVAPAMAATFSPIGTDLILREQVSNGFQVTNDLDQLDSILGGDSSNPGGNVELGSSDTGGNPLAGVEATNAEGATATFTNVTENIYNDQQWRQNVGRAWFSDAWGQAVERNSDVSPLVSSANEGIIYGIFAGLGLFDMITDPNISYINEVGDDIVVGLAGHFNVADRFRDNPLFGLNPLASIALQALEGVQMSEIFAYDIDGVTGYGWATETTNEERLSITDNDGFSYNGNYEVVLEGLGGGYISDTASTPEPSTLLGLMAIGGLVAATKRKSAK